MTRERRSTDRPAMQAGRLCVGRVEGGYATTGLNIVARSLKLAPGDEVLATDHEYGALDRPDLHSWGVCVFDFCPEVPYTVCA